MANAGVASRRHSDELITAGRVRVNGHLVRKLGTVVGRADRVEVDGKIVCPPCEHTYLLLHKPVGVITTMRDPQGRRTVAELLPRGVPVVPVGRLDYGTSGVLLLTDDGELAYRLLHPRFGVEKTYRATIEGRLESGELRRLQRGVTLGHFRTAPAKARIASVRRDRSVIELTLREGRNRQVRRMFEALGHPVLELARTGFGPLRLGRLAPGRARPLSSKERAALGRHRRPFDIPPRTKSNTKTDAKIEVSP